MFSRNWKVIDHSGHTDPALNLALEEFTVRQADGRFSYLLLYRNRPCVVFGRHQNVVREVRLQTCWQENIPVLRRISGGGTVVHDEGNLNFTFITDYSPENFNQYRHFLAPVVRALRRFGAPVEIDARNNLVIHGQKISGNAQFTSRGRLLSHGTLLFDADLERIRRLLHRPSNLQIRSRATVSVPGIVTNVRTWLTEEVNLSDLQQAILREIFGSQTPYWRYSETQWQEIGQLAERKYRTFEWNVAESPPADFRLRIEQRREAIEVSYKLTEGRFENVRINDPSLKVLTDWLENRPLTKATFAELKRKADRLRNAKVREKIKTVLKQIV